MQAARSAAEADGLRPPETVAKESIENEKAAAVLATLTAEKKAAEDAAMERARSAIASAQQQQKKPDPVHVPSAGIAAHMMAAQAQASQSLTQPRKSAATNASNATSPMPQPTSTSSASSSKKKGPPLRRGKWTPEEEAYANRLILEFKAGLLPLTDGTTLRTFLSKLLNCDPMRISKKFVGSNCIGKQVFRRRTADINRLTPEQIQQSRAELSDLERRFLERVAQTNRVKSSGVGSSQTQGPPGANAQEKKEMESSPPSPPWLQTPMGYKQGQGAAMAAAALGGAANNRAAAAGRALLGGDGGLTGAQKKPSLSSHGSAGLLAFAELQRRSQQNLLQSAMGNQSSASNLLAAASAGASSSSGLSSSAMAQIARNASAARLAGLTAAGNSMNNLMMKTGLSRDQLTQLAREQGMTSSASLSNMMERQSSFDALMSLDFQSLQSIDNLANLIQTGGGLPGNVPEMGMKNWSSDGGTGNGLTAPSSTAAGTSSGNLSGSLANARRLASAGRMESLLRSLSSNNVKKEDTLNSSSNSSGVNGGSPQVGLVGGGGSNANFSNLLQSMQSNLNGLGGGNSNNSLFGSGGEMFLLFSSCMTFFESYFSLFSFCLNDSQRS